MSECMFAIYGNEDCGTNCAGINLERQEVEQELALYKKALELACMLHEEPQKTRVVNGYLQMAKEELAKANEAKETTE